MFQQVQIIGNLGRDPEMRYLNDGTPVTSFSVATSRTWTDSNGQRQERTVWFRINAWQRLAETCHQYLTKGRRVFVVGEMQEPRPYQGSDGEWRASLDVRAQVVKFLSGREDGEREQASPQRAQVASDDDTELIPFRHSQGPLQK